MLITSSSFLGSISSNCFLTSSFWSSNFSIWTLFTSTSSSFEEIIFLSSAILSFLPITPPDLVAVLPPVILPVWASNSPDTVTILKEFFIFLDNLIALSILSTITVFASASLIALLYFFSVVTSSEAIPITPSFFNTLGLISGASDKLSRGKNVTLPSELSFKYVIKFLAIISSSTTIFCINPPRAISIAYSYFSSVDIKFAIVPWTLLLFLA